MKRILIIRLSSIGDIVLTTPIVRTVKKQLNAEVHFLTKKQYESILEANPYIDHLHLFSNFEQTKSLLKNIKFDFVIDLHHNVRTKRIKHFLTGKKLIFNKLNIKKWLITNFKIDLLPDKHIVDRYFEAVKSLGIKNDFKGLDFFIKEENEKKTSNNNFTALCISAGHFTKKLPEHKLNQLLEKIESEVFLLGGKEDVEISKRLHLNHQNIAHNYVGKINIQQSASIIKQAKKVICFDTGMMHIAAAFNKEIISIWGNTIPQFGMYPYYFKDEKQVNWKAQKVKQAGKLKCRPCSKIGYEKCPKGHFNCMEGLDF